MDRSEPLDVEHRLGEGPRGFLGQVVADPALDEAVLVGAGASALCFALQWTFAILAPSGNGWPLPRTPAR